MASANSRQRVFASPRCIIVTLFSAITIAKGVAEDFDRVNAFGFKDSRHLNLLWCTPDGIAEADVKPDNGMISADAALEPHPNSLIFIPLPDCFSTNGTGLEEDSVVKANSCHLLDARADVDHVIPDAGGQNPFAMLATDGCAR